MTFVENYDGFLVYDNYCMVTITSEGITKLEYGKRQINGFTTVKIEDMADAYQVLLANFKEGSDQVITDIDIGYKYQGDQIMDNIQYAELLPVWRIKIKGASEPLYLSTSDAGKEPIAN